MTDTIRVFAWYVLADGKTSGPWDEATIVAWFHQGVRNAQIRPDTTDESFPWLPMESHPPFARELLAQAKHWTPATPQPTPQNRAATRPGNSLWRDVAGLIALSAVGVLLCSALFVWAFDGNGNKPSSTPGASSLAAQAATPSSKNRDLSYQVDLVDWSIHPLPSPERSLTARDQAFVISGRVRNLSPAKVTDVRVELTGLDCPKRRSALMADASSENLADCERISETTVALELEIPPSQARNFRKVFHAGDVTTHGELHWLEKVRASGTYVEP